MAQLDKLKQLEQLTVFVLAISDPPLMPSTHHADTDQFAVSIPLCRNTSTIPFIETVEVSLLRCSSTCCRRPIFNPTVTARISTANPMNDPSHVLYCVSFLIRKRIWLNRLSVRCFYNLSILCSKVLNQSCVASNIIVVRRAHWWFVQKTFEVEQLGLAHDNFRQVQKPFPEDHLNLASKPDFWRQVDRLAAVLQVFEVVFSFLEFLGWMDANVCFVVDLPAPTIVVEWANRHHILIEDVGLCMKNLFMRLVHL